MSQPNTPATLLQRREFLQGALGAGGLLALNSLLPAYAATQFAPGLGTVTPPNRRHAADTLMDIAIREQRLELAGQRPKAMTLNNSIPGPVVELYEGQRASLRVTNHLAEDSSIHWHGILLPFEMDGVPGVTFPGIKPGDTFNAEFDVRQYGTYWYHSHSGLQEQLGVYGPMVVHPAEPEPWAYDRDYVVMLSDWTFEDPHRVLANLKGMADYYNFQQRTSEDFIRDARKAGTGAALADRAAWGGMRMMATDIADITGETYTYLMNGLHPAGNWTGLFRPGERVRLRFINGSAMSYFNVRIPGLPMTVIQADGQNIQPVETDEFQIGVAETFDVIVQPQEDAAYTVMAESMDRSGYTRGTLAPRLGMEAAVPPLRERPMRTMVDMGMDMSMGGGHGGMKGMQHGDMPKMKGMDHQGMSGMQGKDTASGSAHGSMAHGMRPSTDMKTSPAISGFAKLSASIPNGQDQAIESRMERAGPVVARHDPDTHGPGNISVATVQRNRLGEPGTGLEDVDHRVLTYADLRNIQPNADTRPVDREIELHLTGNMERYMWSFDGKRFHEVDSTVRFNYGERLRLILVNDTMMEHPIHLHGMFMELENGHDGRLPLKHTLSVKASERASLLITANERGRWAFHCHLLYHMKMGMFRVVEVV